MKTTIVFLLAIGISALGFSQKSEIKSAEKALRNGDAAQAKTNLEKAASLIDGAETKLQAQYYTVSGDVYYNLAQKGDEKAFQAAIDAYRKVIAIEEASGNEKYMQIAVQNLSQIARDLVNTAIKDNANNAFEQAADKLYMSYTLSPSDTVYLYYAAGSAVNAQNYERALDYYNTLKSLNYDGSGTTYTAVNIETGEVETMDKATRDLYVRAGTHKDPKEEKVASKRPEIIKNIALIYQQLGDTDKALAAYTDARAANPEDVNLILGEANLHYTLGHKETFKTLMAKASAMAPNNPDLLYNIGVINMELGDKEKAREAYKKTLEIDPNYINALLNLSTTYVTEGNDLVDAMNSLGNSEADNARYKALRQKKDTLFRQGAEILEDALQNHPDHQSILMQLKNIYSALGDTENVTRLKKMLGE